MIKTKEGANIQDLLKFLALIAMMIDHYGMYLVPWDQGYRVIGRFAFPIFAFYTGYNFHGKIRHLIWILGATLIGLHIYILGSFLSNILVTLAFGQLYLSYCGPAILKDENMFFRHFCGMMILVLFTHTFIDYGTLGIAFMMVGYLYRHKKNDDGYLMLATLGVVIYNEYSLSQMYYNLGYALASIFSLSFASVLLKYAGHNVSIPINIKPITRNMLYIYFISIAGLLGYIYSRR